MIVCLNDELRSILSINRHCLKLAFKKRILPNKNQHQQHPSKIYFVFQQQPQNLFCFPLSPT